MNVLINRTDALGDTLLTSGLGEIIKKNWPKSRVIFLVRKLTLPLFEHNPFVDQVLTWNPSHGAMKAMGDLVKRMKEEKITHYFFIGGDSLPGLCALFAGISHRGGLISRWPSFFLLNHGIRQERTRDQVHEVIANSALLNSLQNEDQSFDLSPCGPKLYFSHEEASSLKDLFHQKSSLPQDAPYLLFHPGMTGHSLNLGPETYSELLVNIEKSKPDFFHYVVGYTSHDQPYIDRFRQNPGLRDIDKARVIYWDGQQTGLRGYMVILANAFAYFGGSTGPTHFASVLGTPIFTFYSPLSAQTKERWGPWPLDRKWRYVFSPEKEMSEIKVNHVMEKFQEFLREKCTHLS